MHLEAVIVCVNYSDFLAETLPENLELLERVVIVTHPDDRSTKLLCNKFGIDFIETEVMYENGDKFNKGRSINLGLSHLRHAGWLLHLDADIILPHDFRKRLAQAKLDEKNVYGADRLNCLSYDNWSAHKAKTVPQHQWRYLVTPQAEFPMGARLLHQEYGWCPIGYFQLWHSSMRKNYPITCGSAEHSDVLFSVQWPRERRVLLPEFLVYHLESDPKAKMGANWIGRTTPHFGPSKSCLKPPRSYNPDGK